VKYYLIAYRKAAERGSALAIPGTPTGFPELRRPE